MADIKNITVPDIGDAHDVDVIEILVKPGDKITKEQSIITLESDKATMEIPAPNAGIVKEIKVKVGDKVSQNDLILTLETTETDAAEKKEKSAPPPATVKSSPETAKETTPAAAKPVAAEKPAPIAATTSVASVTPSSAVIHAGPSVRRLAREFGVNLNLVTGTGQKNRIVKEDVQAFVKKALAQSGGGGAGLAIAPAPVIDFAAFGAIETKPLSKIKKLTGIGTHRSWVTIPHVTQFDEADITELEAFRKAEKEKAESQGVKLTPVVFLMKAVVACLQAMPNFNSSLDTSGENLILKKYFHIGVAVDTPDGLVVPVIRNVDQKGLFELAKELAETGAKARAKKLFPKDMQGSCFTISSLGGIGGTAFTPIINAPDVAILGVSKSQMKPVYQNGEFVPRLMLPLSLSYDHRVIDGADGARFTTLLVNYLQDLRMLLL